VLLKIVCLLVRRILSLTILAFRFLGVTRAK